MPRKSPEQSKPSTAEQMEPITDVSEDFDSIIDDSENQSKAKTGIQAEKSEGLHPEKWYELMNERADLLAKLEAQNETWNKDDEILSTDFSSVNRLKMRLRDIDQEILELDNLDNTEIDPAEAKLREDFPEAFSWLPKKRVTTADKYLNPDQVADFNENFSFMLSDLQNIQQRQDELIAQEYAIIREGNSSPKGLTKADKGALKSIRDIKESYKSDIDILQNSPETSLFFRMATLEIYRQALQNKYFVETPSRQELSERIKSHIENNEPILLEGETGTGKTELALNLCRKLYGQEPEFISGSPDVRASDLMVKQGLRASETADKEKRKELAKEIQEHIEQYQQENPDADPMAIARENDNYARIVAASAGVTPETYYVYGPLVKAMQEGLPLIIDEANLIEPRLRMVLKRIYNAKPGQEIAIAGDGKVKVKEGFGLIMTANLKSEKHTERFDFDEAEKRTMINSTIHVDYLPVDELYDLCLAKSSDSQGEAPISKFEAETTLKNFCDAVEAIQVAYSDKPSEAYAPKDARGKQQKFDEGVLDPGAALRMLNGLEAKSPDEPLADFLNRSILNYASNRNYKSKDRELIAKIFLSKGFLQNASIKDLEILDLNETILKPFRSQTPAGTEAQLNQVKELNRRQLAELDPYGLRKLANAKIGEGFMAMVGEGGNEDVNPESREQGEYLSYNGFSSWLKTEKTSDGQPLESKLEDGSLEALIIRQEKFYQNRYGNDFELDLTKIKIDKSRLEAIKKGLENGAVNYPLIIATPETIDSNQTEAEFAYHNLLEPLKKDKLKIWAETGTARWTGLTLDETLEGYLPFEFADFNVADLIANWQTEIQRIIDIKKQAPKVQANQISLVMTDSRQNIPQDQKLINQQGEEVENKFSFIEMIKAQVKALTPQEWITLAGQTYAQDKTYLSQGTYDWQMAVLAHTEKNTPVSAASAYSNAAEVRLDSADAGVAGDAGRWRCSL